MARVLVRLHGRAAGVAAGLVLISLVANFVAPGVLAQLNLTSGYGWSLLRFGHRETHLVNRTGHWLGAINAWKWSGPALALAGERLVIDYAIEPREGSLSFSVVAREPPLFLIGETLGSRTVREEERGQIAIELPKFGFYSVWMSFSGFSGRAEVDWEVR